MADLHSKDDTVRYIYVAYITLRNGRRLYAKEVGLKAFRIPARK